jgi:cytochrome b6-f complex iron-sulfur subunit
MTTSGAVQKPTASAKRDVKLPGDEVKVEIAPITRREFLFYVWGASLALFTAETVGIVIWYLLPRFREGEFGGTFSVSASEIPSPGDPPLQRPDGKFWVSHLENGSIVALYSVCTHLGCLYAWVDANFRFECPCHGSKFELDGAYIEGPAPRGLDRFALTTGSNTTPDTGEPVPYGGGDIEVDTGNRIRLS